MALLVCAAAGRALAGPGPAKLEDVRVYLVLVDDTKIIGELAAYDARSVTVRRDRTNDLVRVSWQHIKPVGCYYLQKRLTDPNSAEANFRLGWYCKQHKLYKDSQEHFSRALKLDPSYASRIRSIALGEFRGNVPLAIELVDPDQLDELEKLEQRGEHRPAVSRNGQPDKLEKYQKIPASYQRRALDQIRTFGDQVNKKLELELRTVETDHFVIFTEWDESTDRTLGAMFERVYERLCAQFDIPADENIYLGKLPVFAYTTKETFLRHANDLDHNPVAQGVVAYVVRMRGFAYQHMVIFRYPNTLLLEKIVTHECVHSFVNRFRTNQPLPGWLNEGLAEVMTGELVPRARVLERAREYSRRAVRGPIQYDDFLNTSYASPSAGYYSLCTTMVDYLIRKDPALFLDFIDRIKQGSGGEAALKAVYRLDYNQFARVWSEWVAGGFPRL